MRASLDYVYNDRERSASGRFRAVQQGRALAKSFGGANEGTSLCTPTLEYLNAAEQQEEEIVARAAHVSGPS